LKVPTPLQQNALFASSLHHPLPFLFQNALKQDRHPLYASARLPHHTNLNETKSFQRFQRFKAPAFKRDSFQIVTTESPFYTAASVRNAFTQIVLLKGRVIILIKSPSFFFHFSQNLALNKRF
jgi:hypothetical protein